MEFDMRATIPTNNFMEEENAEFFDYLAEDGFEEEVEDVFKEFEEEEEMFARVTTGLNALEKTIKRKHEEQEEEVQSPKNKRVKSEIRIAYDIAKDAFLLQYDKKLEKLTEEIVKRQPLHNKMTMESVDLTSMSMREAKEKLAKQGGDYFPSFDTWKKTYQPIQTIVISQEEEEEQVEEDITESITAKLENAYEYHAAQQETEMTRFYNEMSMDQKLASLDINNKRELTENELMQCLSTMKDKKRIMMQCLMGQMTLHHARYADYFVVDCLSQSEPKKRFVLLK
jgi:hypothetical protein